VPAGLLKFYPPFLKARGMKDGQEKDHGFLGNDTFPNPFTMHQFVSEYLERRTFRRETYREYERLIKAIYIE